MKLSKTRCAAIYLVATLLLLSATACKKATTPASNTGNQTGLSAEEARQYRLSWNLKTLVEPYEHAGHTNPKWDDAAKLALTEFARTRAKAADPNEPVAEIISTNVAAAIQAGCDDPMVNYLFIKYSMSQTNSKEAFTAAFYKTALAMESSSYPDIRKFYAGLRTIEQYTWANNWSTNWPTNMMTLDHRTIDDLCAVLNDASTPAAEVYDACYDFLGDYERSKEGYPKFWQSMEPLVFKNWSSDSSIWLLKGQACIRMAWLARGNGYANTVSDEGWELFSRNLAAAKDALEHAWKMNPHDVRIPVEMMTVMLGQGGGRERMETWFDRAMTLDPNNYEACSRKLYYLEPKWYGSASDMLAFGRECVKSPATNGDITLLLVSVHEEIYNQFTDKSEQPGYWQTPMVWNDLKSAYDHYFEINPNDTSYRHQYAHYAYQCEQWNEFLHQVSMFNGWTNYDYFGGKEAFDQMVQVAAKHSSEGSRNGANP